MPSSILKRRVGKSKSRVLSVVIPDGMKRLASRSSDQDDGEETGSGRSRQQASASVTTAVSAAASASAPAPQSALADGTTQPPRRRVTPPPPPPRLRQVHQLQQPRASQGASQERSRRSQRPPTPPVAQPSGDRGNSSNRGGGANSPRQEKCDNRGEGSSGRGRASKPPRSSSTSVLQQEYQHDQHHLSKRQVSIAKAIDHHNSHGSNRINSDSLFSGPDGNISGHGSNDSNNNRGEDFDMGSINVANNMAGHAIAGSRNASCPSDVNSAEQGPGDDPWRVLAPSLAKVRNAYGPQANIYTDVLKVSPNATSDEIREAFFCLRYDIYQKLERPAGSHGAMNDEQKRGIEERMDAITEAFHVVGDEARRRAYNASLLLSGDSPGQIDVDGGVKVDNGAGSSAGSRTILSKLPPPQSDSRLPIGQRRSVFRRRAARSRAGLVTGGGMNEGRQAVARSVTGGLNARPSPTELSIDNIFEKEVTHTDAVTRGEQSESSKLWTNFVSDVNNDGDRKNALRQAASSRKEEEDGYDRVTPPQGNAGSISGGNDWLCGYQGEEQVLLGMNMNNLNATEQMPYKNQMHLSHPKELRTWPSVLSANPRAGQWGSRYSVHGRGDRYASHDHGGSEPIGSPTGVDDLDSLNDNSWRKGKSFDFKETADSGPRPSPTTTIGSNITSQDVTVAALASPKAREDDDTVDEDDNSTRASSMYDDDTRNYDDLHTYDGTRTYDRMRTYDDETTTLGETVDDVTTVGESTWASEYDDDDATSYATNNTGNGNRRDSSHRGSPRYSPGHKKGKRPAPILKTGSNRGSTSRSDSDGTGGGAGRRVTIHSHRGRGEDCADDFSLFDGASCPVFPSFSSIQEEVSGTYKDFTSALHQVSNAFVIRPDDIDRMADKIRDAKIELGENYHRQKERQAVGQGGQRK